MKNYKSKEGYFGDESEQDFYDENFIQNSLEDDEINSTEEGFMMGYLE